METYIKENGVKGKKMAQVHFRKNRLDVLMLEIGKMVKKKEKGL